MPARSGIGSSSAFTVGLLNCLQKYLNIKTTKKSLATESIFIEQKKIGENVGSQDQVCVAYGGFNNIKFEIDETFKVNKIKNIKRSKILNLEKKFMLFHTGVFRTADVVAKNYVNELKSKKLFK